MPVPGNKEKMVNPQFTVCTYLENRMMSTVSIMYILHMHPPTRARTHTLFLEHSWFVVFFTTSIYLPNCAMMDHSEMHFENAHKNLLFYDGFSL